MIMACFGDASVAGESGETRRDPKFTVAILRLLVGYPFSSQALCNLRLYGGLTCIVSTRINSPGHGNICIYTLNFVFHRHLCINRFKLSSNELNKQVHIWL